MSQLRSPRKSRHNHGFKEKLICYSLPQYYIIIPSLTDTFISLMSLLNEEITPNSKIIVFGVTANMISLFAKVFSGQTNLKVYELHSRLSQSLRTRTTEEFKVATNGIMFASDVVGRGMDFPNVDLVIQVGLPSNAEQYVHRVGRTARAGNTGRAVILLTQSESFFLRKNAHLPIKPYEKSDQIISRSASCVNSIEQAMHAVDEDVKRKAYSSYLGFLAGSGLMKPQNLDKAGLVKIANELAVRGMHCPEPPAMEKSVIGKMGLKGTPGLRYAKPGDKNDSMLRHPPQKHFQDEDEGFSAKKPRSTPSNVKRDEDEDASFTNKPKRLMHSKYARFNRPDNYLAEDPNRRGRPPSRPFLTRENRPPSIPLFSHAVERNK